MKSILYFVYFELSSMVIGEFQIYFIFNMILHSSCYALFAKLTIRKVSILNTPNSLLSQCRNITFFDTIPSWFYLKNVNSKPEYDGLGHQNPEKICIIWGSEQKLHFNKFEFHTKQLGLKVRMVKVGWLWSEIQTRGRGMESHHVSSSNTKCN